MIKALDNQPQRYDEYEVKYRNGEIFSKNLTERGHVSIDTYTAKIMNNETKRTGLHYEIAEDDNRLEAKAMRSRLFAEAKELGINVPKNIKTETLQNKINEAK